MKSISCLLFYLLITFFSCKGPIQEEVNAMSSLQEKKDSLVTLICPMQISCYILSNAGRIKSLKLNQEYKGRILVTAQYDTLTRQFKNHEIMLAHLAYKQSDKEYLTYRSTGDEPIPTKLAALLPKLIKHLSYLKIVKTNEEVCITPRNWIFPIEIE